VGQFNMHVIHQTNKTTAQIFPQVIDTYHPDFKKHLDVLANTNVALTKAGAYTRPLFSST
jgi:magnesium-protoporphyrin IX monomethyl ester (oxidative) cyclase